MVILEAPYVSDHLLNYLQENNIPVLQNDFAKKQSERYHLNLKDNKSMVEQYKIDKDLYLTSENALDWVYKYLADEPIISKLNWIKNKANFRELIKELYPNFFFERVKGEQLAAYDIDKLRFPVVLKPAVGFFSLGVYVINNEAEWYKAVEDIKKQSSTAKEQFPESVVDLEEFIVEEYIKGTEYAIDAYYNETGEPVILNIFTHRFASADDVSDRIYYTSKEIIENYKAPFEDFLASMNRKLKLINFPMHVEVRAEGGKIVPIEVNPMRFAGLSCTDIAYYAYGINTIDYYLNKKVPDFKEILKDKAGKLYSLIVLDKKEAKLPCSEFDYDKLVKDFEHVIKLRKVDTKALNIFGFVFVETRAENDRELDRILHSDLMEYMKVKSPIPAQ